MVLVGIPTWGLDLLARGRLRRRTLGDGATRGSRSPGRTGGAAGLTAEHALAHRVDATRVEVAAGEVGTVATGHLTRLRARR